MVNGYPINWALPAGSKLQMHPLYIKWSNQTIGAIDPGLVQQDIDNIYPNSENAEVLAFLSWIVRTKSL
ncbi:MAG: hypothetical protein CMA11_06345 [Euryarchaeota archaeon]|nr:hypothetical protein [Euryarchaeota archaeon]